VALHNHAVVFRIKLLEGKDGFGLAEHVYGIGKIGKLLWSNRTEPRIPATGANGISDYFFAQGFPTGANGANTASELAFFMQAYKYPGGFGVKSGGQWSRDIYNCTGAHIGFDRCAGKRYQRVTGLLSALLRDGVFWEGFYLERSDTIAYSKGSFIAEKLRFEGTLL